MAVHVEKVEVAKGVKLPDIKPNPEDEYHHVRIKDPERFDTESFRVIIFDKGIKATIGCPKGQFKAGRCRVGTQVQKLLFPKKEYTEGEAKIWVKKHRRLLLRKKKK